MLNYPETLVLECRISAADQGQSLLSLLTRRFSYHDANLWENLIREGRVRLNGQIVDADCHPELGDLLSYQVKDSREPEVETAFEKVLETQNLLLVGKPAGTPVTRTGLIVRQTLVNILRRHYRQDIHPLHRLDRETSGLILCARDRTSCARYHAQDHRLRLGKFYLALVSGCLDARNLTVDFPLATRETSQIRCQMWPLVSGKPCLTRFHTVMSNRDYSLILADLRTGRRHQIRAHLAHLGHPLIGDKIYSHEGRFYLKRIEGELSDDDFRKLGAQNHTLHAWALNLQLPERPARIYFSNLFSDDFRDYLHIFPNWQARALGKLSEIINSDDSLHS